MFEIPVLILAVLGVVVLGMTCGLSLTAPIPFRYLRASIRDAVDLVSIFFLYILLEISEIDRLFVVNLISHNFYLLLKRPSPIQKNTEFINFELLK